MVFLSLILWAVYLCAFSFVLGLFPVEWELRPSLRTLDFEIEKKKKNQAQEFTKKFFRTLSKLNKPICSGFMRQRLARDLSMAQVNMIPEEFFVLKEVGVIGVMILTYPVVNQEIVTFWLLMSFCIGYMMPEYWLKGRIKNVKSVIVKELPDAIDLLGLCVNAGLDFMLALKWVIEKSPPSVLVIELNVVMQEINVGKTRRDALKDLATKYELPDLSTFARTLIQADKMGTSVSEALNILSEDMRLARFRRGEQMALKAPIKMLVPLLFCIFPVVGILVAAPIMLDFIQNNPMQKLAG